MENKTVKGNFEIEYDDVGFHGASFTLKTTEIEQYLCKAGYMIYRAKISDKELRKGNKECCGMRDCMCGSGLEPMESDGNGNWWIEIDTDQLTEDWDDIMENN